MTTSNPPRENPVDGTGNLTVAVVVPMYNAESTIVGTLKSIVGQTMQPQQIIVVDDVSTDGSAELVTRIGIPNLQVVRQSQNAGAAAARNLGVRHATTDLVAFVDADDVWEPTFLEEVRAAIETTGADFASSGGMREKLGPNQSVSRLLNEPAGTRDHTADFWHIAWSFMPAHPSSTIVRRSLFEEVGGFPDLRPDGDWPLWASLWLRGRFAFVNRPLFNWVQLSTGLTAARPKTFSEEWARTVAIGGTLRRAIVQRKPGTRWFLLWYSRMIVRRNFGVARSKLRHITRRTPSGSGQR